MDSRHPELLRVESNSPTALAGPDCTKPLDPLDVGLNSEEAESEGGFFFFPRATSEGFLLCRSSAGAEMSFPPGCRQDAVRMRSGCRQDAGL